MNNTILFQFAGQLLDVDDETLLGFFVDFLDEIRKATLVLVFLALSRHVQAIYVCLRFRFLFFFFFKIIEFIGRCLIGC